MIRHAGTAPPRNSCRATRRQRALRVNATGCDVQTIQRHPEDARDFSIQPPSGKAVDEFVLKFQKLM